jgi:hypothetical protein
MILNQSSVVLILHSITSFLDEIWHLSRPKDLKNLQAALSEAIKVTLVFNILNV